MDEFLNLINRIDEERNNKLEYSNKNEEGEKLVSEIEKIMNNKENILTYCEPE